MTRAGLVKGVTCLGPAEQPALLSLRLGTLSAKPAQWVTRPQLSMRVGQPASQAQAGAQHRAIPLRETEIQHLHRVLTYPRNIPGQLLSFADCVGLSMTGTVARETNLPT